jgi:pimeloyl-ACP methyl ester carboxylesterase
MPSLAGSTPGADHAGCRRSPQAASLGGVTSGDGRAIELAANGLRFSGLEWGPPEGRTVLLLHGFPQRSTSWTQVAGRLAEAGLRGVAVDQRGYSDGARPSEVADYARADLVADVAALIEVLGGAADLVGHDWGAVVGWDVAALYPASVRTWTAVSTPNPLALAEVLAVDDEQRASFGYMGFFREAGKAEATLLADGGAALRQLYGDAVEGTRVERDIEFFSRPGVLTAALNWYRAMSPEDASAVPRIKVPTSYVWGAADIAFRRAAAERSGSFVDAAYRFVALDGVSHWVPDEAPDALAEEIARRVLGT